MSQPVSPPDGEPDRLFPGGSEMAGRMRAFDWPATDLGPPAGWPEHLRVALRLCLTSRFPIVIWWGPAFTVLYNDAYPTAGIYGYTHAFGGYAGSHAEYVRVPHADVGCFHVPEGVKDEQALFLSDAAPTGYMGADFCGLKGGETVAVWGCGGVGLMAQKSAWLLGAGRVIGIDRLPERLRMAREHVGSETIDFSAVDSVPDALKEMTGGRGPDCCIDAVGMEAHVGGLMSTYDAVKQQIGLHTDRAVALREAIYCCRKGGTLVVLGVYGVTDKFPMGVITNKGLTVRTAQQHGQAYMPRLLAHAAKGELDPSFLATHRFRLEDGPTGYRMFKHKEDGCVRSVFMPA